MSHPEEQADKSAKPLILQSGSELMDTALGGRLADSVVASGKDWVRAIKERRMPSRHTKAPSR